MDKNHCIFIHILLKVIPDGQYIIGAVMARQQTGYKSLSKTVLTLFTEAFTLKEMIIETLFTEKELFLQLSAVH